MKIAARILVVDDCPLLVFAIRRVLARAGYQVLGATSSQAAIEILRCERVDLVISDIHMPGQNGVELLRFVQQQRPDIPFIMVSGHESPMNMFFAARSCGADFTLKKPLTTSQLIESVEAALDRSYASQIEKEPVR